MRNVDLQTAELGRRKREERRGWARTSSRPWELLCVSLRTETNTRVVTICSGWHTPPNWWLWHSHEHLLRSPTWGSIGLPQPALPQAFSRWCRSGRLGLECSRRVLTHLSVPGPRDESAAARKSGGPSLPHHLLSQLSPWDLSGQGADFYDFYPVAGGSQNTFPPRNPQLLQCDFS